MREVIMKQTAWPWQQILIGDRDKTFYFYTKRCLDIMLTTTALIVLTPLMLFIAILIKFDSRGPVFFIQERVGSRRKSRDGYTTWEVQNFRVYKFRSMTQNADQSLHRDYIKAFVAGKAEESGLDRAKYKLTNDPRVTLVGQILRRTSLGRIAAIIQCVAG